MNGRFPLLSLGVLASAPPPLLGAPVVGTSAAAARPTPPTPPRAEAITPGSAAHRWRHLAPQPRKAGAPSIPQWSAIYDFDYETNGTGTTDFTNLLCAFPPLLVSFFTAFPPPDPGVPFGSGVGLRSLGDANLTALEVAVAKFPSQKAMWSAVATCEPNATKVYGEPYCGGPTGLWMGVSRGGQEWKTGADSWVASIKDKKWVTGLWLGDEPEIMGVPYAQMCELSKCEYPQSHCTLIYFR